MCIELSVFAIFPVIYPITVFFLLQFFFSCQSKLIRDKESNVHITIKIELSVFVIFFVSSPSQFFFYNYFPRVSQKLIRDKESNVHIKIKI